MPPIPAKLVKRIQEGNFLEKADLAPECLCNASLPDDTSKTTKLDSYSVGSILEWVRCFSCFIAVIYHSQPQRVIDLLGDQNLILTSHLYFPDFKWEKSSDFRSLHRPSGSGRLWKAHSGIWPNKLIPRPSAPLPPSVPSNNPVLLYAYLGIIQVWFSDQKRFLKRQDHYAPLVMPLVFFCSFVSN